LKDNGVYRCSYSNLSRHKEIVIYTPLQAKNIELTHQPKSGKKVPKTTNTIDLEVGENTDLLCRVSNTYPKPNVSLTIDTRPISNAKSIHDISGKRNEAEFQGFTLISNVTYKAIYSDHLKNVNCKGSFDLSAEDSAVTRSHKLNITGVEIIEESCLEYPTVEDIGVSGFRIKCRFFSNPFRGASWQIEIKEPIKGVNNADAAASNVQPKNLAPSANSKSSNDEIKFQELTVHSSNNYKDIANVHMGGGIYEAVFTIEKVRKEDLRKFKLTVFDDDTKTKALNKIIELHTKETCK
jgi:hypothetical protein